MRKFVIVVCPIFITIDFFGTLYSCTEGKSFYRITNETGKKSSRNCIRRLLVLREFHLGNAELYRVNKYKWRNKKWSAKTGVSKKMRSRKALFQYQTLTYRQVFISLISTVCSFTRKQHFTNIEIIKLKNEWTWTYECFNFFIAKLGQFFSGLGRSLYNSFRVDCFHFWKVKSAKYCCASVAED